jgi:hypothetical protein
MIASVIAGWERHVMIALVGAGRDRPIDLAASQWPPRRATRTVARAGSLALAIAVALAIALLAAPACTISHVGAATPQLRQTETAYTALRSLRDTLDITRARGLTQTPAGEPLPSADRRFLAARTAITHQVAAIDTNRLRPDDRTALATLSTALATDLADDPGAREPSEAHASCDAADPPPALAAGDTTAANTFRRHLYDCFGRAAMHIVVGGDTADRLTILGRLAETTDSAERRQLFLALTPVWRAVNGNDDARSPYRTLLRFSASLDASANPSPLDRASEIGVAPGILERWLVAILDTWRVTTPDTLVEPWDYYYVAAAADRQLAARIPRDSLLPITLRFYLALGADVPALGVHYDLAPRPGKNPVANTTFGSRGHMADTTWIPSESWVFATYEAGGLGNLDEIVHETGHAIHLAAIHERPEYVDWPDSDPLTEAIADIPALSVFEPEWQYHFLGDSVPTAVATRAKYASIMLDIAWALFEVRLHDHPDADPNEVWTGITSLYLHIAPHPEWSWWAMRGQLIDAPGYMMNYALGAVIVTAIRERIVAVHGSFASGDTSWYRWLSANLLRYGLARPTRDVLPEFLGGPLSDAPLLRDLARMRPASRRH